MCLIRGSAGLSQFSISWIEFLAYCTFPHVPFSLLPYSDTTRSASDTLITCGFIMQGASTFSKKKWYQNGVKQKEKNKTKQNFCKKHSVHMIPEFQNKRPCISLESELLCAFASNYSMSVKC